MEESPEILVTQSPSEQLLRATRSWVDWLGLLAVIVLSPVILLLGAESNGEAENSQFAPGALIVLIAVVLLLARSGSKRASRRVVNHACSNRERYLSFNPDGFGEGCRGLDEMWVSWAFINRARCTQTKLKLWTAINCIVINLRPLSDEQRQTLQRWLEGAGVIGERSQQTDSSIGGASDADAGSAVVAEQPFAIRVRAPLQERSERLVEGRGQWQGLGLALLVVVGVVLEDVTWARADGGVFTLTFGWFAILVPSAVFIIAMLMAIRFNPLSAERRPRKRSLRTQRNYFEIDDRGIACGSEGVQHVFAAWETIARPLKWRKDELQFWCGPARVALRLHTLTAAERAALHEYLRRRRLIT